MFTKSNFKAFRSGIEGMIGEDGVLRSNNTEITFMFKGKLFEIFFNIDSQLIYVNRKKYCAETYSENKLSLLFEIISDITEMANNSK